MKINITFPYNTCSGAFRSTYELSNHLSDLGNDVVIYIPFFPFFKGENPLSWMRGLARSFIRRNRVTWFDLKVPVKVVPTITDRYIRDAEVVISNHWPTAFSVAKLSAAKGRKFNFIRDTNPWSSLHQLELESLRLPLEKIAVASWLRDHLVNDLGIPVKGVVDNGTNISEFLVSNKKYNNVPVICLRYCEHPQKDMASALAVLEEVKKRHPEVKIVMFGLNKPMSLPFEAEFHHRVFKKELVEIYEKTDIFLFTSVREGSGNPPREAMLGACAVVATNVGCIPDCTIPGETALVVEPGDVNGMVKAVCSLIENPEKRIHMGRRAQEYIQQFTWEKSTSKLLELLRS